MKSEQTYFLFIQLKQEKAYIYVLEKTIVYFTDYYFFEEF
jgi:hypothetical protein